MNAKLILVSLMIAGVAFGTAGVAVVCVGAGAACNTACPALTGSAWNTVNDASVAACIVSDCTAATTTAGWSDPYCKSCAVGFVNTAKTACCSSVRDNPIYNCV